MAPSAGFPRTSMLLSTPCARPNFGCKARFRAQKSAAPRKRSIIAWRRRPNPRVMQCPRQEFCLAGMKKVQRASEIRRSILPAETRICRGRICLRGRGGPPDCPRRRRPRCLAPAAGSLGFSRSRADGGNAPASIPGGSGMAVAAECGFSTARRAAPVAAPSRAPAFGRCSGAG
jgi:hypothetical protein